MTEEMFGVTGTRHGEVFFTERSIDHAAFIDHISVKSARHNSNLGEIKQRLAAEALARGSNVVMNFRYGQKKKGVFFRLWDDTGWYGEGDVVRVD